MTQEIQKHQKFYEHFRMQVIEMLKNQNSNMHSLRIAHKDAAKINDQKDQWLEEFKGSNQDLKNALIVIRDHLQSLKMQDELKHILKAHQEILDQIQDIQANGIVQQKLKLVS